MFNFAGENRNDMHAITPHTEAFRPADTYALLQSPTRVRVLETVRAAGPLTFTALADTLALSNLKLRHHLSLLHDAGLVRFRKTRPDASPADEEVVFRPVGWARLRKRWTEGMGAVGDQRSLPG